MSGTAPAKPMAAAGDRLGRALQLAMLALSAAALITFGWTVAGRIGFAWPLEWMEGASVQHALRLLHGEPLYPAPSAAFIPYLYPPLSYLPMALSLRVFGPSLPAARLASLGCSLLSLWLLGRAAARTARDATSVASPHAAGADATPACAACGWLAAATFALGFGYTGAFLDLARVDACFIMLVLAGAERLQAGRPRAALAWLALSAFAKQHGLLLLLGAALGLLAQDRRRHGAAVAIALAAVSGVYGALALATSGWLARYCLLLPLGHGLEWPLLGSFFLVDLLLYLPVLTLAAGAGLWRRWPRLGPFDALLCAALLASALGRAHPGGHDNVRLPAFALLCIAGVAPLCRRALEPGAARGRLLAFFALWVQLAMLWQAPSAHQPPASSAASFGALRAALQRCAGGGSAVALDYALLAGTPFAHTMALSDLRMGRDRVLARAGTAAMLDALASPQAPAAVAVGERFAALQRVLQRHYHECARVPAPTPATGYRPGLFTPGGLVQIVYARGAAASR